MADDSQHPLWCKHCEVEGHLVIHCHALYEELTNFDAAVQMAQGPASDPKRAYPVAHWGQGKNKRVYGPGELEAAPGVPVQGIGYPSNPFTLLNPLEAHALANDSDQQWEHSL